MKSVAKCKLSSANGCFRLKVFLSSIYAYQSKWCEFQCNFTKMIEKFSFISELEQSGQSLFFTENIYPQPFCYVQVNQVRGHGNTIHSMTHAKFRIFVFLFCLTCQLKDVLCMRSSRHFNVHSSLTGVNYVDLPKLSSCVDVAIDVKL